MAEEKAKVGYCPNCGEPAIKEGNRITCEKCDAVFRVTENGARIEKTGVLDDHERRLAELEAKVRPQTESESKPKDDEDEGI